MKQSKEILWLITARLSALSRNDLVGKPLVSGKLEVSEWVRTSFTLLFTLNWALVALYGNSGH
jgi:hypothetical protein